MRSVSAVIRVGYCLLISLIGTIFLAASLYHVYVVEDLLAALVLEALPIFFSGAIVYAGLYFYRSNHTIPELQRITLWFYAAVIAMVFVAITSIEIHIRLYDSAIAQPLVMYNKVAIAAGVAGLLIGLYDTDRIGREREQRQIIDLVPDPIFARNRSGEYLLANEALAETYGRTPEEIEGRRASDLSPESKSSVHASDDDSSVIESGTPQHVPEETIITADGVERIVETTKIPYAVTGSEERAILGYARDITEQKEYERTLENQRDNLEILNAVVRHDIRNDLHLVKNYATMLESNVDDSGEEYLSVVQENAEDAIELTTTARKLADVLLREDDMVRAVDLGPPLRTEIADARAGHATATVTIEGEIPNVAVTGNEMLEAVFRNLLQNAIVHNDTEEPTITVLATCEGDTVQIQIADDGPGVPDDKKETVFGRGEQGLKSSGTGIGLHLVYTLVDSYGGDIWIEDNEPRGAVFVVELPLAAE